MITIIYIYKANIILDTSEIAPWYQNYTGIEYRINLISSVHIGKLNAAMLLIARLAIFAKSIERANKRTNEQNANYFC